MASEQPGGDLRISQLRNAAMGAATTGRLDDAARFWEQVLALAPEDGDALQFFAQRALQRGDFATGRGMFERAARAAPRNPIVQLGLAFACRKMGDDGAEMSALTAALSADPYCYPAMLAKGASFERRGLTRQAAHIYKDALRIVPSDERLAPGVRNEVAHARTVVRQNMEELDAFLERKIAPLRATHAQARQGRAEEAKNAMIGRTKIYTSEASLFRMPELPAIPFFDRSFFPWMAALEAQTDVIREELLGLLDAARGDFHPYVDYPAGAPLEQWAELNKSPRWSTLYLIRDGVRIEANCARCPRTLAALESVPLASIPGAEPLAMFSALEPHTRIPPHTGITNARAVSHLPLILPGNCGFRVGNDSREWKMGEAWAFDDSMEHEAWNDSDQLRVILIFNVWNPYMSEAERDFAAALISGFYEYQNGG